MPWRRAGYGKRRKVRRALLVMGAGAAAVAIVGATALTALEHQSAAIDQPESARG